MKEKNNERAPSNFSRIIVGFSQKRGRFKNYCFSNYLDTLTDEHIIKQMEIYKIVFQGKQ